jgi:hypothetical protein
LSPLHILPRIGAFQAAVGVDVGVDVDVGVLVGVDDGVGGLLQ